MKNNPSFSVTYKLFNHPEEISYCVDVEERMARASANLLFRNSAVKEVCLIETIRRVVGRKRKDAIGG